MLRYLEAKVLQEHVEMGITETVWLAVLRPEQF
jgi:hypothetical protein